MGARKLLHLRFPKLGKPPCQTLTCEYFTPPNIDDPLLGRLIHNLLLGRFLLLEASKTLRARRLASDFFHSASCCLRLELKERCVFSRSS